jgi:glycerate kinase
VHPKGFARVFPSAGYSVLPIADGGEGTAHALVSGVGGSYFTETVPGPLGTPVEAQYAVLKNGAAVIEMAAASGLDLVPEEKRDPSVTTTYGTGQLIRAALDRGCRKIFIGIGGSATNDGGAGMAQALGARLLDQDGHDLSFGGGALFGLETIDVSALDPRLKDTEIVVFCDVKNPLCGPDGASAVYGPQKGADESMIRLLDSALLHYGEKLAGFSGRDVAQIPGSGAAGGLGAGLLAFCSAALRPGFEEIASMIGLEAEVAFCALVITGEGRIDATSANGKVLSGVGQLASKRRKPAIASAAASARARRPCTTSASARLFPSFRRPWS